MPETNSLLPEVAQLSWLGFQVEMPPVKLKAIKELGYGTNAKVVVGFTHRFWREKGFND